MLSYLPFAHSRKISSHWEEEAVDLWRNESLIQNSLLFIKAIRVIPDQYLCTYENVRQSLIDDKRMRMNSLWLRGDVYLFRCSRLLGPEWKEKLNYHAHLRTIKVRSKNLHNNIWLQKLPPKIQNQIAKQTTTSILFHPKKVVIMHIS